MKTSDFSYELPPELIATRPTERRDACRLLALTADATEPRHLFFRDLPGLLREGDLLVLNDTRVIPARLVGKRLPGGGEGELLLLEPAIRRDPDGWTWECLARPGRKLREGKALEFPGGLRGEIINVTDGGERLVRFSSASGDAQTPESFLAALEAAGHPPLPPYILAARRELEEDARPARDEDREQYQTVFAREGQSVAAPTAGLHFTPELLEQLSAMGVEQCRVRLDVGAGTFKPVDADDPREHPMHEERYWIGDEAASAVNAAKREGRRVVCVGTTVTRALEAAAQEAVNDNAGEVIQPGERATKLMIFPGHRWRALDALITNFHLPRSTLLMLVAALRDRETILAAYEEAVARGYRFYSYGDAMFLERKSKQINLLK
jgi:S-adenosylmethionine:tRNA ribosyltransferase-isomerase